MRKKGYAVANEGVNGDTIAGALKRFDFDNAIAPGTQIAIVFGTSDLRLGASMPTVRERLAELIRSLRARGIKVLYARRRAPRASDGR